MSAAAAPAPVDLLAAALAAGAPGYGDAIEGLLDAMASAPPEGGEKFRGLDLGAAGGSLSQLILERHGGAHMTLVEASAELLNQARRRLAAASERCEFVAGDFARIDLPGSYHLIVSAFAVHRLGNIDKRALYRRAYAALVPGGTLLIADIVKPPSAQLEAHYRRRWRHLAGGPENRDFLETAEAALDLDHGATLAEQLEWITNTGLIDVDIHTKRWHFAVFGGRRREA
jgi:tRNA (cmo5U34)-methyltransferase